MGVLVMKAAIVNTQTNLVANIIVADPHVDTCPYEGHILVAAPDTVNKGFQWTGTEFVPPPVDPPTVSAPGAVRPLQFRREVKERGRTNDLETWLSTASEDVQLYFEFSHVIRMTDPEFVQFAALVGFTQEQIDQFFIAAAQR
jgi:hypothetical protein